MTNKLRTSLFKVLFCMMVVISFVLPTGLTSVTALAADKPSIDSELSIGTGSTHSDMFGYSKDDKYNLVVYNPVKKATYTFTSSNKNVVTVKTSGTKAYLTGVKAGTATITCTQKLNGKSTKVGTCKVTVHNAVAELEYYDKLPMGTGSGYYIYWRFRNNDAKYTFTSSSKDFTLKLEEKKDGDYISVYQTYTAKKAGKYTVTVKETYNKKERTLGKLTFEVVKSTVNSTAEVYEGDTFWAFEMINNYRTDCQYLFDFGNDGIVDIYNEEGIVFVKGLKVGTATVNIYEDTTKVDKKKLIGTCKVNVTKLTAYDMDVYFDDVETFVGDNFFGVEVYKYPYHAPDVINVTSSDPSVATIKAESDNYFYIVPVSAGKVTITVTCGDLTKSKDITVYKSEDAMYGYDDEDDDYDYDYDYDEDDDY